MKKLTYFLIVVCLAAAGWLVYSYYFSNDPVAVTKKFYGGWLAGDYRLSDSSYKNIEAWTDQMKKKAEGLAASFNQGDDDPILCAQDKPDNFLAYEVGSNEEGVRVEVREDFSGTVKTVQVSLIKVGGKWKIDDIVCNDKAAPSNDEEQNLVSDYIKENISELSPEKAVLGGTFSVTSLVFGEGQTGVVEYEDGHILLRAGFKYSIGENNVVKIESFEVLPEESGAFSETGNLVKDEGADGWLLVYEKPGQPALRVMLEFGPNSRCQATDGPITCSEWEIGDRAKIDGRRQGNKVAVDLAIEERN
ncbi:MAG TPA: DUF3828 domain-containing protein [Candidatus Paceibacterota bacterium]|nr:DUF3828 domain-containing protein [Candidatus Paceibacterota bacterium]